MSWDPRGPEAYCMGNACSAWNWLLLGYAGVGHGQLAEVSQGCPDIIWLNLRGTDSTVPKPRQECVGQRPR